MNFTAFNTEIDDVRRLIYNYQEAHTSKPLMANHVLSALEQPFSQNVQDLEDAFLAFSDPLPTEMDSLLTEFKNHVVNPTPDPANPFAFLGFQGDFDNPLFRRLYTSPFRENEINTIGNSLFNIILQNVQMYRAEIAAASNVEEAEQKLELMAMALDLVVTWMSFFLDYTFPELGTVSMIQPVFTNIADNLDFDTGIDHFKSYFESVNYQIRKYKHNEELVGLLEGLIPPPAYVLSTAKYETEYQTGDVIATLSSGVDIRSASVTHGALPCGMELNAKTGTITISNPADLSPGVFYGAQVTVEDDNGNSIAIDPLLLEIKPNCEPEFVQVPSYNLLDYFFESVIAKLVLVEDGVTLHSVKVCDGKLPPGVGLHSTEGAFFIYNTSLMKPGDYAFKVEVKDTVGGVSERSVTIVIGDPPSPPSTNLLEVTNVFGSQSSQGDTVAIFPSSLTGLVKAEPMSPVTDNFFSDFVQLNPSTGEIKLLNYNAQFNGDYLLATVAHLEDGSLEVYTGILKVNS